MANIPCGDKILDYLAVPALKKLLHPIFCFQTIVGDFRDQSKKLSTVQERVENDVQRDSDNAQVIYENVERWLKEVIEVMPKVEGMLNELFTNNKSCFRCSWCPNWTCHYRFSKKLSETTATMKILCANGDLFISVSHPPTLHQDIIGSSSSVGFIHSHSSKTASNQIMEALRSDDINLIGLYGEAGTGKTTLAEQVAEVARAVNMFPHVIMVPVSQIRLVRSIQGFIAGFLGLSLDQLESEQAISAKLQLRLKKGPKILIILDDVRKDINLGEVGILSVGCKLLLTAHAKVQVPNSVHTQRDVELGTLLEDEAWTLFERVACVGNEGRKHGVAKDALAECCGLPKAIVAIGATLNGKGVSEWIETLCQFKEAKFRILDILKKDAENLILRREKVNTKIKMAKQNVHKIYPEVEKWLKDVEMVLDKVEQFDNELNQNKWCFDERDLTTNVEALQISIKDLYAEGEFDQVSHPTPLLQDMRFLSSQDFMFSEAAESAFSQMMEALKADGVKMTGLYGMGGIGKTTLANQVQNEVVRQNIFTHSVMVTVSQKPDVRDMQDKIAEVLGFDELKKINTLDGRASKLCERLENEKILIIMDDVWKPFDIRTIGVALDNCKCCKILVTTRRRDVCSSMNCQSKIQLNLLSEDEAQNFFMTKVGLSIEFELDDVAKQIVEECKCLPIALETVGAALKNKGKDEWTEALEKLRSARLVDIMGVEDDEKNAYRCVKVSYDYLKGPTPAQQAQFILLLCSIFPEDYKIEVEDLTRYAFGMELFERVSSIEDARRKVRVAVRFLKDSCLLLDIGDEEYVKMHDVVRDTVLWIGGTETQERKVLIFRDNKDMKELAKKKSFQNCRAVSFTSDVILKLSKYNKLECPNLETVLIFSKGGDVELGEGFFEHTKLLKVLDIKGSGRWARCKFAMPQSFGSLECLRTLMLRYCECSNSCTLNELRKLKLLSLEGCKIDGGVEIVSGLKKLRLLDLSELEAETRMFSSNVIESFIKLEELHGYTFSECEDEEGTSSSLSELMLLSNLVALSVQIKDKRCLPTSFYFPNLQNYYIRWGVLNWFWLESCAKSTKQARCLELRGDIKDESVLIRTVRKLLPTVQDLVFKMCRDLCSLDAFTSHAEGFLQRLESLVVENCTRMEWMFEFQADSEDAIIQLQLLKILRLEGLRELEHAWKGPTRLVNLCNLTQVDINRCEKLRCIFSSSLATSMQQLERLKISWCLNLEEIISMKGDSDDDDYDFSHKHATTGICFTNLRELQVSQCGKVKTIFPIVKSTGRAPRLHPQSSCRLPKLHSIVLEQNKALENIFGHQTQSEEGVRVECPSLQVLVVTDCPNISTTHFVAAQLQLEEAPSPQPLKADSKDNIQGLEQSRHDDLSQNTIVCSSTLKRVELRRCNKLKQVFVKTLVTDLSQLEVLIVEECDEIEQVISKVEDGKEEPIIVVRFENMKTLKVNKCGKLKTIFPITISLPKLETLELTSNAEIEHGTAAFIRNMCIARAKYITVDDIKGVEEIMQIERQKDNDTDEFVTCQLVALYLRNIVDLKYIWHGPTQDICFEQLYQLQVIGSNKLKHLLQTTIATTLPKLKHLTVKRCNELEQVIVMAENGKEKNGGANGVVFRELTTLEISECEKLKTIFTISIALPKLERLQLERNKELERVFGESDWDHTQQYPVLEDLRVVYCPKMCIQKEMKPIKLHSIQGDVKKWQRFPLEKLVLWNVQVEEVKCIWGGPTLNIWLENLVEIEVIGCNRLKHIFATPISTSLPNLKSLIVRKCNELEQVMMILDGKEERAFENLQVLHVSDCVKLKTIFSTSVLLPHLICLRVESNAELESLFGESDCDYISRWTGLKQLSITRSPKLCTHSIAIIQCQLQAQSTAKNLDMINLSNTEGVEELVQFQRQGDDDDNNHYNHATAPILKLEEVRDLKRIWSGPTQNISFSFLNALRVIGCNRLKQLFTTTMATTLHHLVLLSVERCHDLEHVIQGEEDGNEENNLQSLQQLDFSKLKFLRLLDLPKLVSFCPSSCDLVLSILKEKNLQVEGCPKPITDFFSQKSYKPDDKDEDEDEDDEDDNNHQGRYSERSKLALLGLSARGGRMRWLSRRQVRLEAERFGPENESYIEESDLA